MSQQYSPARRRVRTTAVAATTLLLACTGTIGAAGADNPTPEQPGGVPAATSPGGVPAGGDGPSFTTWPAASAYAHRHLGANPPGANDFTCRPAPGTRPVVLVPGTGEDAFATWSYYAPRLKAVGLCVYSPNYNVMTRPTTEWAPFTGDIRSSAAFLSGFVDKVLDSTGAQKVDMIGHSQGGGPLPRAYLKYYGGDTKVEHLIGLVPSNHGTTAYGINRMLQRSGTPAAEALTLFAARHNYASAPQQLAGSAFLADLNSGGLTRPGVKYTVVTTRYDDVVTPYTNALIREPGVTNIIMQNVCALDHTDHFGFTYDPVAFQVVHNALRPEHAGRVTCRYVPGWVQ